MDDPLTCTQLQAAIDDLRRDLAQEQARAEDAERRMAAALLILAVPASPRLTAADWGARPEPAEEPPADPDELAGDAELGSQVGKEIGRPRTPPAEVG